MDSWDNQKHNKQRQHFPLLLPYKRHPTEEFPRRVGGGEEGEKGEKGKGKRDGALRETLATVQAGVARDFTKAAG